MIAADRLQLIRGLERVGDVADGQAGGGEPRRIGDDLDLPRVADDSTSTLPTPATRDSAGRMT